MKRVPLRTHFVFYFYFLTVFSFLLANTSAKAQVVGATISGTVRDASGAAVPQASITVHNLETGAERRVSSDGEGHYAVPSVPVGRYEVTAEKDGFSLQSRSGVNLVIGESAVVDFSLAVGEVREEIAVTDAPQTVNPTTQPVSGLVNERQVKELPLNGRSFDELITLNPAVVNYTGQRSGSVGTTNSAPGNMFAVAGRRPQDNLFLLNGIEYTGASEINVTPGGVSGQLLGVDAVREFNVVYDTYGAEYGKRTGAQVSIVTASGTNQLHGSAFEFLRNSALDARNYFDQADIPIFQRNQFGGSLGGPLLKSRLLLFGNYEGFRQTLGLSNVTLVPDNTSRAQAIASVRPLLDLWPVQNGPELGGGIAIAYNHPLQHIREDFGTTRLDYNISQKDSAFAVYTIDDSTAKTPTVNPLSVVDTDLREQVLSAQEQHIFSSDILNTVRIGFSRGAFFFTGETPVSIPGWVAGKPIGAIVIGGGTALNGASQISLAGTNAGSNLSAVRNLFTWDDHVFISHGKHQLEAGAWLQKLQSNSNLAQYQYGQASFTSLNAFLSGTVTTFTVVPTPTELGWRSLEGAGFVQDTLRLKPNLELRFGFRFESTNGWNEEQGRASNFIFDEHGVLQTNPRVGSSAFTENRAKFLPEPRVGLAWSPGQTTTTVVHAGFGIYRALLDSLDYRLDQNAPFNTTQSIKNIPVSDLHFAPGQAPPTGSLISPSGIQPDAHTPTLLAWSLNIEQQVAPATSLTVGYLGSHGYHQMLSADMNEPVPVICPASPCPTTLTAGTVYYPKGAPFANPALANSTTWISRGVASYNGLTIDIHRRFQDGFQLRAVYTFSKNLDEGTAWNSSVGANAPGFVMYPAHPDWDYGPANTDIRHLTVINGTYELPFGQGKHWLRDSNFWQQKLISGWTVSAIANLQSGLPFTPQLGFNPSNNGDSRNPVRPSINPEFHGKVIEGTPVQYFNPTAFVVPVSGTYGNLGRNTLTGPGLSSLDFSLRKNTALTERLNLQFRGEIFNLFNHANFGTPNTVVYSSASSAPSPTAGVITTTATTSRQIQFGLKLLY
ncbi:MAG: carboxypeptidase regulatory-like domain-containing protein [Acidobacterium ailaaui]|nr:carboxypeptidase regulatory-like domain-containing protein [Pseudacidobacterium ailaaui]